MGIGEVYDLMLLINVRELMQSIPEGEGTHTRSAITYQWAKVAGLTVVQLAPIHDAWTNENDDDDSNDEKCSAPAAADAADDVLTASTTTTATSATPASTTTPPAGTTATEPSEPTSFGSSWCSSLFAWHPVYISISTVLDTLRPWISHADSGLDLEQLLVRSWSSVVRSSRNVPCSRATLRTVGFQALELALENRQGARGASQAARATTNTWRHDGAPF